MENEIRKGISYGEIEAICNSAEPPSAEDITNICDYFGMNGSSDKKIMQINGLGVPIKAIIDALEYGENSMHAYGSNPQITNIALGEKNRNYALIILGDCGKTADIISAYPLNDFRQIKQTESAERYVF
jgi:hypothetical protein